LRGHATGRDGAGRAGHDRRATECAIPAAEDASELYAKNRAGLLALMLKDIVTLD
jgi:hypothetical protein